MTQIIKAQVARGPNGEKDPNDWARSRPGELCIKERQEVDPLDWTSQFEMSDDEVEELADPEWIYENLIISGHLIVIPAEPNAGKTTIMEWISSRISDAYRVVYVNADISGGDAKAAHRKAKDGGYDLLLPDMKVGQSMDSVVDKLKAMNQIGADLLDVVMVFDTLKKMVDVISKRAAKDLYKTLRSLTAKGMTIVLLAHTNKYKGDDGRPVYEGTGDLRSDVDEMIYLIPIKNDDGSMTVSTAPDKVRGKFEPITFEISPDREVNQTPYVDVIKERRREVQMEDDADDIATIDRFLATGSKNQSEIVTYCKDEELSRRRVLTLLKRYSQGDGAMWQRRNNAAKQNAAVYSRRPPPRYLKK